LTWLCYAWDAHGAGRRLHPAFGLFAIALYTLTAIDLSL
jgi:hypothetical protein